MNSVIPRKKSKSSFIGEDEVLKDVKTVLEVMGINEIFRGS